MPRERTTRPAPSSCSTTTRSAAASTGAGGQTESGPVERDQYVQSGDSSAEGGAPRDETTGEFFGGMA